MASCLEDLIAEQITPSRTLMVLPQKTDIYPGCITMNEFSSSMRWSTTQQNRAWRQFQWVWLHFQRSRSVQLCAKYSQIRKHYIESLSSVLKDKNSWFSLKVKGPAVYSCLLRSILPPEKKQQWTYGNHLYHYITQVVGTKYFSVTAGYSSCYSLPIPPFASYHKIHVYPSSLYVLHSKDVTIVPKTFDASQ